MKTRILHGDCLAVLPTLQDKSIQCCVTSPPYYNLRNYSTGACILAGTSAHGCCSACGAPWRRQTEVARPSCWEDRKTAGHASGRGGNVRLQRQAGATHDFDNSAGGFGAPKIELTIGWQPSCSCDADVVNCTVLDPFGGAGTTAAAATKHGRDAVLIELNEDYIALAEQRLVIVV